MACVCVCAQEPVCARCACASLMVQRMVRTLIGAHISGVCMHTSMQRQEAHTRHTTTRHTYTYMHFRTGTYTWHPAPAHRPSPTTPHHRLAASQPARQPAPFPPASPHSPPKPCPAAGRAAAAPVPAGALPASGPTGPRRPPSPPSRTCWGARGAPAGTSPSDGSPCGEAGRRGGRRAAGRTARQAETGAGRSKAGCKGADAGTQTVPRAQQAHGRPPPTLRPQAPRWCTGCAPRSAQTCALNAPLRCAAAAPAPHASHLSAAPRPVAPQSRGDRATGEGPCRTSHSSKPPTVLLCRCRRGCGCGCRQEHVGRRGPTAQLNKLRGGRATCQAQPGQRPGYVYT